MGRRPTPILIGTEYGRWTVLKETFSDKYGRRWLCRCFCGEERDVCSRSLTSGKSNCCGCIKDGARLEDPSFSGRNKVFDTYKRNASNRGYDFNLTLEEFVNYSQKNCHYCNSLPSNKALPSTASAPFIYNGIDRVDNNKHYTTDNIVSCCKICNRAKMTLHHDEFLNLIKRIAKVHRLYD